MRLIKRRLSPSLVVAMMALFVALAGTAVAAGAFVVDEPSDLGPDVVTSPAIKDGSIKSNDLNAAVVPNLLSAKVRSDGTFVKGLRATGAERLGEGQYRVKFNRPVRGCMFTGTSRERLALVEVDEDNPLLPNSVRVHTTFLAPGGVALFAGADSEFDLMGMC
jgi:hypothetical protein